MTLLIPAVTASMLMYWYQWGARALSPSEVSDYMAKIEAQKQRPGARHNLPALRQFLIEDDGEPVYTVNLYNFHDLADYPADSGFGGSGTEAYDRFSKVMISLMVKRGSHPIYSSDWADQANSNWDRIVIVRYRSRRDLVDLFASNQFAESSLHKWASLREHERMLVQAIHIPDGKLVIMLLAIFLALGINFIGRLSTQPRST